MKTITLKYNRNTVNLASVLLLMGLFYFAGTATLCAQNVGINSTAALPKSSAILDLSTGNNGNLGFLPPKVALTATNAVGPVTTPSNGLLVYDTVSAGTSPNNVTEGLYYWSGTVAAGSWVRLLDIPYGNNTQSAVGSTSVGGDVKTNSSTWSAFAPDMSITFTPVHSVVFLTFTASGITDLAQTSISFVAFKVLKTVGGVTSPAATTGYGCNSMVQFSTDPAGTTYAQSGWNCAIILPISVTAGTSITISIDWMTSTISGTAGYVECNTYSSPSTCFRSMVIND